MACGLWPVVYGGTFLGSKLFTSHPMLGRVGYGLTERGGKHHLSEGVCGPGMLYPTLYFLRGHPESRRELFSSVFYPQCLSVRVAVTSSSVTRTILATSVTMGLPLCEVEDGDDDGDDDDSFFEAR